MYETRKLRKGSFKETCFFGSASITKQKMTNVFYLRFYKAQNVRDKKVKKKFKETCFFDKK